jgi:hypothetical protein
MVATAGVAVTEVADAAADMVVRTVATTVRVMGLATAFRCRCPLLAAGKPPARRPINLKIPPAFAAGQVD